MPAFNFRSVAIEHRHGLSADPLREILRYSMRLTLVPAPTLRRRSAFRA
jgi:hypothetical protein